MDHVAQEIERPPAVCEVRGALGAEECAEWIRKTEALGYRPTGALYPSGYRDNDRLVFDDAGLAATLFARMRPELPATVERFGWRWRLVGLNERFRCCRYRGGQSFRIHRDGAHVRSPRVRSLLTFMVYLNDSAEFAGGATRFFASRDATAPPTLVVAPEQGKLVIFGHDDWHEGEAVREGTKYVLRSDVLYERVAPLLGEAESDPAVLRGHEGYVWQVIPLPGSLPGVPSGTRLASSSRDGTVRIWRPQAEGFVTEQVLRSGAGSVTALFAGDHSLWGGTRDGRLCLWQREGERYASTPSFREGEGALLCFAALPDGSVAAGNGLGEVVLRDPTGALRARLRAHQGWVWALSVAADGSLLSAGEDGSVRRWVAGALQERVEVGEPVRALATLASGEVALGTASGTVRLLDGTPLGRHEGAVRALLPWRGGVVSAGEDDRVRLWRAGARAAFAHDDFVTSLCALPAGRVASSSYDGTIRLWRPGRASRS